MASPRGMAYPVDTLCTRVVMGGGQLASGQVTRAQHSCEDRRQASGESMMTRASLSLIRRQQSPAVRRPHPDLFSYLADSLLGPNHHMIDRIRDLQTLCHMLQQMLTVRDVFICLWLDTCMHASILEMLPDNTGMSSIYNFYHSTHPIPPCEDLCS